MAGQGMDHSNLSYQDYEEPQSESEWDIQNHGTSGPPLLHPISPPSAVSFSAAQEYSVSATVSPAERYLPAGPSYGGYAAQRPPTSGPLQSSSECGLTPRTTFYDPNSDVSGYHTARIVTQPSQHSYYQQTYDPNTAFSAWDSRFEPSHRHAAPVYGEYQTVSSAQNMTEQITEQQRQQHQTLTNHTPNTMGDYYPGPSFDDVHSNPKSPKKGKHKDASKRQGRINLTEPEQPRRKALPETRRLRGPAPDSVNKRTNSSRGTGKSKSSAVAASPSGGRSKFPQNEEYDEDFEEGAEGSSGNTAAAGATRTRHNLVEQKYRNRLNAHFDHLLEVLPNSMSELPGQSAMSSPDFQGQDVGVSSAGFQPSEKERKVSKAEVLDRARLYIQSLENDARRLMADQEELKARFDEYSRRNEDKHGKGSGKC
ncbi:hypothetical protein QBC44DRAFT_327616 [Cladorrhinum sp. PSN332]|nr:hypothetical protein QBC44DRAFT_327616 [Cladorrhinum sp. PSN332]